MSGPRHLFRRVLAAAAPGAVGRRRRNATLAVGVLVAVVSVPWQIAPASAETGDLDGDGRDELVVGVPDEGIGTSASAGMVHVFRGTAGGIGIARNKILTQRTFGGATEAFDRFGTAVAYGDFDGDGNDDIAIGAPAEDLGGSVDTGVVHVVYGSGNRRLLGRNVLLAQDGPIVGRPGSGDFLGASLATGNFNGDRFDDLVIGLPGKDRAKGRRVAAGAVIVVYGGPRGLREKRSRLFSQQGKVSGVPEDFDAFGVAVATGDVDADGFDDVVVGAPGESLGSAPSAGVVHVLRGSAKGLRGPGDLMLSAADAGGAPEAGGAFGRAVAMGDFDADGFADVAVGSPGVGGDAGAVAIFRGSGTGISPTGVTLRPGASGIPGAPEPGAQWGRSLATGSTTSGAVTDLAVGAPTATVDGHDDAGSVTIVDGGPGGLGSAGASVITQGEIPRSTPGDGDLFGWALRFGDFDGDGIGDLAASARGEDRRRIEVGVVHVVPGSDTGLVVSAVRTLSQATRKVKDPAEAGDRFGTGL